MPRIPGSPFSKVLEQLQRSPPEYRPFIFDDQIPRIMRQMNVALAAENKKLKRAHPSRQKYLGEFYLVDTRSDVLHSTHLSLHDLAKRLNVNLSGGH